MYIPGCPETIIGFPRVFIAKIWRVLLGDSGRGGNPLFELINTLFSNSGSVEDFLLLISKLMPKFSSIHAAVLEIKCDELTN